MGGMRTFASLFSGFGGADIGAMQAGLKPIWGVEYDPDIAGVAKTNGLESIVADVREVDYSTLEVPYWLHMSPVCKRASTANANAKEAAEDIETAQACVRAITALRPPFISLENVRGYESFKAFHLIVRALMDEGYNVGWWVLNSADYGVPQTRERLVLVASRTERVRKPIQTHAKKPPHDAQSSLFDTPTVKRWVGWYEAIEDLLPGLEDTKLAEWQMKFMPDELKTMLIDGTGNNHFTSVSVRDVDAPCVTLTANQHKKPLRAVVVVPIKAVLIEMTNTSRPPTLRNEDEPTHTIIAGAGRRPSHMPLVVAQYRIMKLDRYCLARLQSFPKWYQLPDSNKLACKGIGNAKPPLLQQALIEAQQTAQQEAA